MDICVRKLEKAKKLIKEVNEEIDYQQYKQMLYNAEDEVTEILKLLKRKD